MSCRSCCDPSWLAQELDKYSSLPYASCTLVAAIGGDIRVVGQLFSFGFGRRGAVCEGGGVGGHTCFQHFCPYILKSKRVINSNIVTTMK